jgi:hypothetical protein
MLPELEHRPGFAALAANPAYDDLIAKLHPTNFRMSGRMTAIMACILGQEWTDPRMAWLSIDSQGNFVSDAEFIGSASDLERNLTGALEAAAVTPDERALFEKLLAVSIDDHRKEVPEPEYAV